MPRRPPPLLPFRLQFEHDARPYVWTGHAPSAAQAEATARAELFGAQPCTTRAAPRLVQLVQGSIT